LTSWVAPGGATDAPEPSGRIASGLASDATCHAAAAFGSDSMSVTLMKRSEPASRPENVANRIV